MEQVHESVDVRWRRPPESSYEPANLSAEDELLCVDVRKRRDPELRLPDELGEHTAWTERHERAEDRVLHEAGQELRAALDHRLYDHRRSDPVDGDSNRFLVEEVEGDTPRLRLVGSGGRRLDDDRESKLSRSGHRVLGGDRNAFRHEGKPVGEEKLPRLGRVEPAILVRCQDLLDDRGSGTPVDALHGGNRA